MAGANISGLLKNPAKNIPTGTFTAIGVSTVVYAILAFVVGATCTRDGLKANMFIMAHMELGQQYLVLCGGGAATFSSALASLVGAPQVLASIAQDRIFDFPFINCFGVTHARPKVRSSFLLFALHVSCLLTYSSFLLFARPKGSLLHKRCPFVNELSPNMVAHLIAEIGVDTLSADPVLVEELEEELAAQTGAKKSASYDDDLSAKIDARRIRKGACRRFRPSCFVHCFVRRAECLSIAVCVPPLSACARLSHTETLSSPRPDRGVRQRGVLRQARPRVRQLQRESRGEE